MRQSGWKTVAIPTTITTTANKHVKAINIFRDAVTGSVPINSKSHHYMKLFLDDIFRTDKNKIENIKSMSTSCQL